MKNINNYDRIADLYDLYVTAEYDIAFWKKEGASAAEVLEVTAVTCEPCRTSGSDTRPVPAVTSSTSAALAPSFFQNAMSYSAVTYRS